jgi:hypothetical protein
MAPLPTAEQMLANAAGSLEFAVNATRHATVRHATPRRWNGGPGAVAWGEG